MKTILSILILSALAAVASANETDVDATYFHPAASLFIHGDTTSASNSAKLPRPTNTIESELRITKSPVR